MDLFRKGESTQVGHKEMNSLNCEMARLLCASSCWRIVQSGAFSVVIPCWAISYSFGTANTY